MAEQRLPIVNSDDGAWGDILNQYLGKEHYDTGVNNAANGGHQNVTLRPGTATAGTAPLKFTSGPLLSVAESGTLEYLTNQFYIRGTDGLSVAGNIGAGTTAAPSPITAGNVGVETAGVSISGVTQTAPMYVSDAANANTALILLHKHSTTVAPLISSQRSNSDTTSHGDVVATQSLMTLQGTGWSTASYKPAAEIEFQVGTGTVSATSMPGRISLQTTADGAITPTERMSVLANGNIGVGVTSPTAALHIEPGTATANTAPLKFSSGTNLTAAEAGAMEYDGVNTYITNDTSSGRGLVPVQQHFMLTANGTNISTIANFFGANSNISLVSGSYYEIDIHMFFTKNTAGAVTWTLTNSAAPASQNILYEMSPVAGMAAPPGAATTLKGQVFNNTTAAYSFATASITNNANIYASFKIFLKNGTGTSLKIQATAGAGTITPGIGSHWFCKRLSPSNVGTFAA